MSWWFVVASCRCAIVVVVVVVMVVALNLCNFPPPGEERGLFPDLTCPGPRRRGDGLKKKYLTKEALRGSWQS